jgi:hypothetical protein
MKTNILDETLGLICKNKELGVMNQDSWFMVLLKIHTSNDYFLPI